MNAKRTVINAAVVLAIAAAVAPAHAVLERVGPTDNSPTVGGYPAWFQDKTGIAIDFCAPKTQAEVDGGWCVVLPGDVNFPESFPNNFFDEHFYYDSVNVLLDPGNAFKATLVMALEAAFVNGPAAPGDQMTFTRLRVAVPNLPFEGDYRVITPFSDTTYVGQPRGGKIFDTLDIGVACPTTFECTLAGTLGPFLLPSAVPGGAEVPPMPDLKAAPPGTDPFYDQMVAAGAGPTADPGTGSKYLADPARIGAVTGSPLPNFIDSSGASRNHNTFRIEVRAPSANGDGALIYAVEGEGNFSVNGRLMTGTLPGAITSGRATYKADATGNITDLDVFAKASPTSQARIPAQTQAVAVTPVLNFYDLACGGAIGIDPATGAPIVNDPPYTKPVGVAHSMALAGRDYWGQSQPGGLPPAYVCLEDAGARNAAGQVVPAYYLRAVTDDVLITTAAYDGASGGQLSVVAQSTDPTATLTLAGYGPGTTAGTSVGIGAGTGVDLVGNAATITALAAPPSQVQVVSSKGGANLRNTSTSRGQAVLVGVPTAVADSITMNEDCSPASAAACVAGQGITLDLLANDTILLNGTLTTLRNLIATGQGTVSVTAQPARLGVATVTPDGILTYTPNANANGTDAVSYTVTVNGQVSSPATATINITPVNDAPVAGNTNVGAVVGKLTIMNLIGASTDPDGNGDIKNAVLTSWPASLGTKPTPLNGVITYTPTAAGTVTFGYTVSDIAGAVSANTATGTVTVALNEVITFGKHQFVQNKSRWTVDGTDNIIQGQTITVVYENGTFANGVVCNGTAKPDCIIGTSVVDGLGAWGFDKVSVTGKLNPRDPSIWRTQPTFIRAFSTLPSLGGTAAIDIVFK